MSDLTRDDRALVRDARLGLEPTSEDHARIRRRLSAQVGMGIGAAATVLSASAGARASIGAGTSVVGAATSSAFVTVAKLVGAMLVVGGLAGTGVAALRESRTASRDVPSAAAIATTTATAARPAATTRPAEPAPVETAAAPIETAREVSRTAPAPSPITPADDPAETTPRGNATTPGSPRSTRSTQVWTTPEPLATLRAVNASEAPSTPTHSTSGSVVAASADSNASAARGLPATAAAPVAEPPEPTLDARPGPTTVAAEARLLHAADAALRAGDAAQALVLLRQHAATFPHGVLTEERNAERVMVLCALGRGTEAREAAAPFLRDHGHSPLAARVRASCAGP